VTQVAGWGEDAAHEGLVYLKEALVDKPLPGSGRAFAEINRAVATDSRRDVDLSISAVSALLNQETPIGNGAEPIAKTLKRQLYDYRRNNGSLSSSVKNEPRLNQHAQQLMSVLREYREGGGFLGDPNMRQTKVGNEIVRVRLLEALAMTGTEDAKKFIQNRDNYDKQGMLPKLDQVEALLENPTAEADEMKKKFDITTPLEDEAIEQEPDQTEKIDSIRQELQAELKDGAEEPTISTPVDDDHNEAAVSAGLAAVGNETKEVVRESHRITSKIDPKIPSEYEDYDVPDAKALWDYIHGPEYKGPRGHVIGPAINGSRGQPTIFLDKTNGTIELRIPTPAALDGINFRGNQMQPFLENYQIDVDESLPQKFGKISADRHDERMLQRRPSGGGPIPTLATIGRDGISLYLHNLSGSSSGVQTYEQFKTGLENGLKLHRDFVTEGHKTTLRGNVDPSSIQRAEVILNPNWDQKIPVAAASLSSPIE
jgi:hypothetical protein